MLRLEVIALVLCVGGCGGDTGAGEGVDVDAGADAGADVGEDVDVDVDVTPWVCEPVVVAEGGPLPSDAIPRSEAAVGRPILIDVETGLGLGPGFVLSAMAVHPTARRVYLGRYGSYDPSARDLLVLALDAEGHVVRSRSVNVSPSRRAQGVAVSAQQIVVAADNRKLYLASTPIVGETRTAVESLVVLDLDDVGEPVGAARTYDPGMPAGIVYALARNPSAPVLYVGGYGDTLVRLVALDASGEPTGEQAPLPLDVPAPVDGVGIADLVVSRDGRFLYIGGAGALEAYALADAGRSGKRIAAIDLPPLPEGTSDSVRLALTGEHLVRRSGAFPAGPAQPMPLTSIALVDGVPGAVKVGESAILDAVGLSSGELFAVMDRPYRDAYDGTSIGADIALVRGSATAPMEVGLARQKTALLAAAFDDGTPVVLVGNRYVVGNRRRDVRVRVTLHEVDFEGVPVTDPSYILLPQFMLIGSDFYEAPEVTLGEPSPWQSYDRVLRGLAYAPTAMISIAGAPTRVALTIEIARGDPAAGGTLLASLEVASEGADVLVRVPGLGMPDEALADAARLERDVSLDRARDAAAVALSPDERPRRYPIGCYSIIGVQADRVALGALADIIASLGCNMVIPIGWKGLPDDVVREALDSRGITRRSAATYTPPSYFDFDTEANTPEALAAWAEETVYWGVPDGSPREAIGHVMIADEPAWYYPEMLDVVRNSPEKLAFFHRFLEQQGLGPSDFTVSDWSEVLPLGKPADTTRLSLSERMRLYWTLRFFPVSAARGLGNAAAAIKVAVGRDLPVHVNWNNWGTTAWHYNAWDGSVENNAAKTGPERGTGSVDWFETGRLGEQALFTEDWLPDSWLDLWSYRLDILRSAATQADHRPADPERDGPMPFGSYVIPNASGAMREGLSYKILSLLGRGGKQLELFNFGPTSLQSDGWSDQTVLYEPLARALRRVAKAEHVMFPGVPERGRVAIYLPAESLYFDEWETDYMFEVESLHRALTHAGFRVDIVDATGVANGELAHRDYAAFYITAPNVPSAARANIAAWVAAGGTLVVMPGAAVADAYDTVTSDLDEVLGLGPRARERDSVNPPYAQRAWLGMPAADVVVTPAEVAGMGGLAGPELSVLGRLAVLAPTSAEVLATFGDGRPAVTANAYGSGRAIAYGFLAGAQYETALPREVTGRLPDGDGADARRLAVWPAVSANAYGSVRVLGPDGELVEALRLDGPTGTAIVLLDWGQHSRSCLTLSVEGVAALGRVNSVEGRHVSSEVVGNAREVVLERLDAIDILLFEP